jgi:hypothetical protein
MYHTQLNPGEATMVPHGHNVLVSVVPSAEDRHYPFVVKFDEVDDSVTPRKFFPAPVRHSIRDGEVVRFIMEKNFQFMVVSVQEGSAEIQIIDPWRPLQRMS